MSYFFDGTKGVDDNDDTNDILFVVAGTLTAHFAVNYVRHLSSIMHKPEP